ncbi:transcriptional regulator [Bacteroidia bacterium]|nr:transcriptional regulator [Bacteroidia bacterium]
MSSIKDFFSNGDSDNAKGIAHKNNLIKRSIIGYMIVKPHVTLAELTRELHISVPTITKLVGEMVEEGMVRDMGKIETAGGRRPNVFGLTNTAFYFAGVEVARDNIRYVISDLKNNITIRHIDPDFVLEDTPASLEAIASGIESFIKNSGVKRANILGVGVCIVGRANPQTGRSYKYFSFEPRSLSEVIRERAGLRVLIENNVRARCFAEYTLRDNQDEKNLLYLHLGRGIAIGMVLDGKLYYGKSSIAGEFGHTPFFDNELICSCGKKGCLETEVSGMAIENKMTALLDSGRSSILGNGRTAGQNAIHIDRVIEAAKMGDSLSIELIEEASEKAGKSVAFLLNIFNPETVIIGGALSQAGDYLMLPLLSSVNRYSLNLVYKDTAFLLSQMDDDAAALGVAMLMRNMVIGI